MDRRRKRIIRNIWNENGMLEEWKIEIVKPIYKKRDSVKAENYGGIKLMNT